MRRAMLSPRYAAHSPCPAGTTPGPQARANTCASRALKVQCTRYRSGLATPGESGDECWLYQYVLVEIVTTIHPHGSPPRAHPVPPTPLAPKVRASHLWHPPSPSLTRHHRLCHHHGRRPCVLAAVSPPPRPPLSSPPPTHHPHHRLHRRTRFTLLPSGRRGPLCHRRHRRLCPFAATRSHFSAPYSSPPLSPPPPSSPSPSPPPSPPPLSPPPSPRRHP